MGQGKKVLRPNWHHHYHDDGTLYHNHTSGDNHNNAELHHDHYVICYYNDEDYSNYYGAAVYDYELASDSGLLTDEPPYLPPSYWSRGGLGDFLYRRTPAFARRLFHIEQNKE